MTQCTEPVPVGRSTPHASLAILGVKLRQLDFWAPVRKLVRIPQKTVKYAPADKLAAIFVTVLTGAHGLVESETRLRPDLALQTAFGLAGCPEQSVLQDTLNACTAQNVQELQAAGRQLFQQHSRAYHPRYETDWQVLDVDVSGLPCGKRSAGATKGYFREGKNRRGRQLGRVCASRYDEVVVDRLYPGNVQLVKSFPSLVEAAETTLDLDPARRARTILRADAGAGTVEDVNWALHRGYQFQGKDYAAERATALSETVTTWYPDPQLPGREVGWVTEASPYERMVYRIAVRCRDPRQPQARAQGSLLLSTLSPTEIIALRGLPAEQRLDPATVLLAYVYFYDERGGGVETSFKADKPGLGLTHRNKKRFEAQAVLTELHAWAHNVLVWAKGWLVPQAPRLQRYGIRRLIRDVFGLLGRVETAAPLQVFQIVLTEANPLAKELLAAFQNLVQSDGLCVSLGPP